MYKYAFHEYGVPPPQFIGNKRIESLYLLKAVASFFVVSIHSSFFCNEWLRCVAGVGTPCFLAITGYLLYSASEEREIEKCCKWAFKSFRLSIIFSGIYLMLQLCLCGIGAMFGADVWGFVSWSPAFSKLFDNAPVYERGYLLWGFVESLIVNVFTGEEIIIPLWYLTALWEALLLFAIVRRWVPRVVYFLPLLYLAAYASGTHGGFIAEIFSTYLWRNNAIVTSLPFLATGYLIHKHRDRLLGKIRVGIWLPVVFGILLAEFFLMRILTGKFHFFMLATYPFIVLLMLTCVRYKDVEVPLLSTIGRKHSPNIYYFHMAVLFVLWAAGIDMPAIETLVVWLGCIPLSMLFQSVSEWMSGRLERTRAVRA